jgi:hypothetical protein
MKNLFGATATHPQDIVTELPEISEANDAENHIIDEKPAPNALGGVQKAEAVTLLWTKKNLLFAYFL